MSVRRNVRLALMSRLGIAHRFWVPLKLLDALAPRAEELLATVGLEGVADREAGSLAYGLRRALELATTLAMEPQLLLLDEPTQGLGAEDVVRVTELIRRVSQQRTTLMVEHNMGVVAHLATEISVMQRGAIIAQGSYEEVSRDQRVVDAYMGRRGREVVHA
jgi:branched-chain amino acid transport system ATP-binding protein